MLTPLHLGPGLLFGVLTLRYLNLWAILLGSIMMDFEPAIRLIQLKGCYSCPHHGFWHSILGAILGSLIIAAILWLFRKKLEKISLKLTKSICSEAFKFKISQPFSFKVLFFSSLIAWLIHIFFDSLTHFDVYLFWPLKYQPFFIGAAIYWPLNLIFLILGIVGLILIYKKFKTHA